MGNTISVKKQDDNGIAEVRNNFNARLRKINESFGNMEVYDDLIKLRNNILKRFDSAEGRELAFQVQCTARSLLPSENDLWEKLPADIHRLIFSKANKSEKTATCITMNQLLISSQVTSGLLQLRNNWINIEFISPKMFGCENSKQAIEFIIDNELNVANLLEFRDFSDADLEKLSQFRPQLIKLSIGSNTLTGKGLKEALERFTTLRHLEILDGRFYSIALEAIKKLPLLESISLYGNWWQDSNFEDAIENLPWLQNLKLQSGGNNGYSVNMMDKSLEPLKKLTKLKSLEFKGLLAFSDDNLAEVIEKNPLLQSLTFSENGYDMKGDKFVDAIGRLSLLHSLNLSGGRDLSTKIAESIGKLTLLQSLNLSGCYQLGDKLPEMLEKLTLLQSLDISHCGHLHVPGLSEAIEKNTLLTNLDLGGCCNDTDRLLTILGKLPLLKSLGMSNAHLPEDEIVKIIEMLPRLEILDISRCFFPCDQLALIDKFPKLQSLNLEEVQISGDNLIKLVKKLPTLKNLNLHRCLQISDDNFVEIVKMLPNLESLIVPATENEEGSHAQFPSHLIKGDQEVILEQLKELIAKKAIKH